MNTAFSISASRDVCPPPGSLGDPADRLEFERTFFEAAPSKPGEPDCREELKKLKQQIHDRFDAQDRVFGYDGAWDAAAENPEDEKLKGRSTRLNALGDRVEADLKRGIEAQFTAHLAALGAKPDAFDEERALHEAFIESRTQIHIPRKDVERQLSEYAEGADPRALILSGPPGSGKSAILAHWVQERMQDEGAKTHEFLVARFIGASPASTSLHGLLRNISEELRRRFELTEEVEEGAKDPEGNSEKKRVTRPMQVPVDPVEIQSKWPRFLEAAGKSALARQGHVVIVLDAVNQLERNADPRSAYWIPYRLPEGVRMIVSALDHGEASKVPDPKAPMVPVTPSSPPPDWLSDLRRREPVEVKVPDLGDEDRARIIRELPNVFCKTLDAGQISQLLHNEATRNPLFLTVALEELRVFGSFESRRRHSRPA